MTEQEMAIVYPGRGFSATFYPAPAPPMPTATAAIEILRDTTAGRLVVAELERLGAEVERLKAETDLRDECERVMAADNKRLYAEVERLRAEVERLGAGEK